MRARSTPRQAAPRPWSRSGGPSIGAQLVRPRGSSTRQGPPSRHNGVLRATEMERLVDPEIDSIRQHVLTMGGLVETMIADAMRALVQRDDALALQVIRTDRDVDRLEKEIDELCLSVLARFQPMASDVRLLFAVIKMVNDLERMGDSAVNM